MSEAEKVWESGEGELQSYGTVLKRVCEQVVRTPHSAIVNRLDLVSLPQGCDGTLVFVQFTAVKCFQVWKVF